MSVKYQHPTYTMFVNKWQRCEDAAAGQDAIHEAGTLYLPMLSEQSSLEYEAYKNRTLFYNATWRTIVGLQGMLFRKPPQMEVPPAIEDMMENVTLDGSSMHIFALGLSEQCLKIGRVGVFVDYPQVPETATKADAIAENHRPLLKMYRAGSIINWKTRTIKNATILSMVVLKEARMVAVDEFQEEAKEQYRVLDLIDTTMPDGVVKSIYRVRVFIVEEKDGKFEDVLIEGPTYPKIDGKYLEYIPFQFIGVDDVTWEVDEPPLIDLVDVNLSHYRVSADYEHGCHFTGLPTPVVSGYQPEKDENGNTATLCIGSTTAWIFPRHDAKAYFLEYTGEGLTALKDNLTKKEQYMAILGARMLETQRSTVESANTAAIHRGGEQSMLSSVAQAISIGVTKVLKIFAKFAGADDKNIKFELNRDFFPVPMDALTLTAIIAGWQNGAYSYDTMLQNLQKGEIVDLDATVESEKAKIAANPPPIPQVGTTPGSSSPNSPKTQASGTGANPTITQMQKGP